MKVYGRVVKLLAVDSDMVNLLLLEETLKDEDIDIDSCSAGDAALELIKTNQYDVILMDIAIPDMDGFQLRELIRKNNQYIPIIFLTAIIDTVHNHLLEKVAADQFTYYIKKPFDLPRLLELIENVVKNYLSENETRKYYSTLEGDLELAVGVQNMLLPDWITFEDDFVMSSIYHPFHKVSGDIFEATMISPGRYFVLLGDIAGHGIQAALYMSAIQSLVKTVITVSDDIGIDDILNRLNSFFCVDMEKKSYMTCLVALFDFNINRLQFISAGHLGFFMHDSGTNVVTLLNDDAKGAIPVGWMDDYVFDFEAEGVEIDFNDECSFFGITDGIIEMCNEKGSGLGPDKLKDFIEAALSKTIVPLVPYYALDISEKSGYNVVEDDICMIMIKRNFIKDKEKHLQLVTMPTIAHADVLGMNCERFIIKNTDDERLAVQIELLLNEFINNIIMHGLEKHQQERPKILVDVFIEEHEVHLKIWDKGREWSFSNSKTVVLDENVWDYNNKNATAGRGMAIMKSIAETIECNRYGDLNETSFVIKREG